MSLFGWVEHRTGIGSLLHEALYERIPGGARWRYVWGSTLVFAFVVQAITGIFLWMFYSPSNTAAWESVYYIQYQIEFGWLLRGLHHFMAQAMIVLLVLHLMQVVIDGAYRAPREFNFWIGLILMKIVLGLSLTGYLLPWDQKGYWATRVATSLMGLVPVVGEDLQYLVVGGQEYGSYTLTRFFALHTGVLPAALLIFLAMHIAIFRRHGIHTLPSKRPTAYFWPDQVLKDAVACLAVLAVVLGLVFWPSISQAVADRSMPTMPENPGEVLGAHLDAPADGSVPYAIPRPEWYFLFLFQFLKYFEGGSEEIGAIYVPGAIMLVLFLMPIVGRWKLGHAFNVTFLLVLVAGAALLTAQAWYDDNMARFEMKVASYDPDGKKRLASESYLKEVELAHAQADRAIELAGAPSGIPPTGALTLLRNDPKLQGPSLFIEKSCGACHSYTDPDGHGIKPAEISAPNLYGFATREWVAGLLDPKQVDGPNYFGNTAHKEADMVSYVKDDLPTRELSPEQIADIVAALSAEAALPEQAEIDNRDAERIAAGRELITGDAGCTDCHKFHDAGELGSAPDLTGYGSRQWLIEFIGNPCGERFYEGERNDRMPIFCPNPHDPTANQLTDRELSLIVDWLRGDWYRRTETQNEK